VQVFTVVIPWRPQPSRLAAFDRVVDWYRREFPDARIVPVDSGDEVFNLSRCRNVGVGLVEDVRSVVVLNDADTIPERGPLLAAVAAAAGSPLVHLPYTEYRWLGAEGSEQFAEGTPLPECSSELVHGACSGVYVTTPETWWSHGGQDERFAGWGYEDAAWSVAHETLLGAPPARHEGRVFALHHVPQPRSGSQYEANAGLMDLYRRAAVDVVLMRQLVAAPVTAENARSAPGA
jgi:hypothetical protein